MGRQEATIDWDFPRPRAGLLRYWDEFIGPGATTSELVLMVAVACAAAVAVPAYALAVHLGWDWLQLLVAAVLAFDIAGGVVTNAASVARRWYHRPGQGFRQHFLFTAIHLHPLVVSWLFLGMDWAYFGLVYGYLIIATLGILLTPLYLQRPVSLAFYTGGLLISLYLLKSIPGLEWFVPLFYLKLLVCHLVREEPYRPA